MNQEDVSRLAKQVGFPLHHPEWQKAVDEFAALISANEREACAKVCEDIYNDPADNNGYDAYYTRPYLDCAAAIRARGKQ